MNLYGLLATSLQNGLQVVLLFVIFVVIVIVAYVVTYYIARLQRGSRRNSNLEIIEAISVGQQKSLQLVRIGKEYAVIGVTKQHVELIHLIKKEDIKLEDINGEQTVIPFKQILKHYSSGLKRDSGDKRHETEDD